MVVLNGRMLQKSQREKEMFMASALLFVASSSQSRVLLVETTHWDGAQDEKI